MTDLEITKLCAVAMGITGWLTGDDPMVTNERSEFIEPYDPLHDDAQCMALVKKLFIEILVDGPEGRSEDWTWTARIGGYNELPISISHGHDLNRAVCVCVAKLAKEAK